MKREIFEISAEINGISNIIVGLSNQLDNSKTDTLSTESMQQAMFLYFDLSGSYRGRFR